MSLHGSRWLTPIKRRAPMTGQTEQACNAAAKFVMYRRLLVPIDGRPPSAAALNEAIRLARACGARLRLVHVLDALSFTNSLGSAPASWADVMTRTTRQGESMLESARSHAEAMGLATETTLCEGCGGSIATLIVEMAVSWEADLIVAGAPTRQDVGRVTMRSNARDIVRTSPVPVLLVKQSAQPMVPTDAALPVARFPATEAA